MRKLIIADVRSACNKGNAIGHYFGVAENYYEVFSNLIDTRIAGGPVYACNFKNLIELKYNTKESGNVISNKIKIFANLKKLMKECSHDDIVILQSSGVFTTYLGLLLYHNPNIYIYSIQYNTESINKFYKKHVYHMISKWINVNVKPCA